MNHFFAYIGRMRFIRRWALMRNSEPENIQEHSHMTAVLAHSLALIRNRYFGGQVDPGAVAAAALLHDAPEIFTGDLPTPIKYLEEMATDKLLHMLPRELRADYRQLLQPEDQEIRRLVKAADKLSAYIKCLEEEKAGNAEFRSAQAQTRKALEEMDLPEVRFFMDEFMPSFRLTLDELE